MNLVYRMRFWWWRRRYPKVQILPILRPYRERFRIMTVYSKAKRGKIYIIAEIGGIFTTFEEALALIDAAHACGVDAIKLQTFTAEKLASKKALFDMENTGIVSQFDLFKKYEISEELHRRVFDYIRRQGA